jgi:lipopolysaccharide export system protein LptA
MPVQISRLRFGFAAGAIVVTAMVAGAYFYAKWKSVNALKQVPEKIGLGVQQSAQGFTYSKSEAGRTMFTIRAGNAVQYKGAGRVELHDVNIIVYGRDSSRFDQIYGKDFDLDTKSGDVEAKGEVQIDLEANPEGLTSPDQSAPREMKNPVHLRTNGLIFNQKTGDAHAAERVDFNIPQASGSAVGMSYFARDNRLIFESQMQIVFNGETPTTVLADHGTLTKYPQVIVLEKARLQSGGQHAEADQATVSFRPDNTVDRLLAEGRVSLESNTKQSVRAHAERMELILADKKSVVRSAILTGAVQIETGGPEPMQGNAGQVALNFAGRNILTAVHSEGSVKLVQHQRPSSMSGTSQDMELAAPAVDFVVADGHRMKSAETSGPPRLTIRPVPPGGAAQGTVITADRFQARFDDQGQLSAVHGARNTRVVSSEPQQPDRVTTGDTLDATIHPGTGLDLVVQQGNFAYTDGERRAWSARARYTPADQVLVLTGSPRLVDRGMTTTATTLRMNRQTGDAFAEGGVKTTYSDLKLQPSGALLASSSPIHVTSQAMTVHRSTAIATYTGDARLWQEGNLVQAPSIEFDRDRRFVVAHGAVNRSVSTVLVQSDSHGKVTPVTLTSQILTYEDSERRAHFDGGVRAAGAEMTVTSAHMDIFFRPRDQQASDQAGPTGKIERIVASDQVVAAQPERKAEGDRLVYTAEDDKFVLTGNSPSIFDAEHGRITGVSLTFFRADDRVLVEGNKLAPSVTRTRVAR